MICPRTRLLLAAAAAFAMSGTAAIPRASPPAWLVNESPSLPRGVYLRTRAAPTPGAIVAVDRPPSARPYLAGLGAPGDARLLKRIAVGPGEVACREGLRLTWARGQVVARAHDRRGTALPAWGGSSRARLALAVWQRHAAFLDAPMRDASREPRCAAPCRSRCAACVRAA